MDDCNKGSAAAQLTVVSTLCVCVCLSYTHKHWSEGKDTWRGKVILSIQQLSLNNCTINTLRKIINRAGEVLNL